jgi:hypothetical protein
MIHVYRTLSRESHVKKQVQIGGWMADCGVGCEDVNKFIKLVQSRII